MKNGGKAIFNAEKSESDGSGVNFKKLHVPVRRDFCRAIYLTLLQVLPKQDVMAFYEKCPLSLNAWNFLLRRLFNSFGRKGVRIHEVAL